MNSMALTGEFYFCIFICVRALWYNYHMDLTSTGLVTIRGRGWTKLDFLHLVVARPDSGERKHAQHPQLLYFPSTCALHHS